MFGFKFEKTVTISDLVVAVMLVAFFVRMDARITMTEMNQKDDHASIQEIQHNHNELAIKVAEMEPPRRFISPPRP